MRVSYPPCDSARGLTGTLYLVAASGRLSPRIVLRSLSPHSDLVREEGGLTSDPAAHTFSALVQLREPDLRLASLLSYT